MGDAGCVGPDGYAEFFMDVLDVARTQWAPTLEARTVELRAQKVG